MLGYQISYSSRPLVWMYKLFNTPNLIHCCLNNHQAYSINRCVYGSHNGAMHSPVIWSYFVSQILFQLSDYFNYNVMLPDISIIYYTAGNHTHQTEHHIREYIYHTYTLYNILIYTYVSEKKWCNQWGKSFSHAVTEPQSFHPTNELDSPSRSLSN